MYLKTDVQKSTYSLYNYTTLQNLKYIFEYVAMYLKIDVQKKK